MPNKPKDNEEILDFLNEAEVLEEMKDNKLSDDDKEKFLSNLKENWYLDSDNLNFLIENKINFFSFDEEECFCRSKNKFESCCKKKISKVINKDYKCAYEALKDADDWEKYKEWSSSYIKELRKEFDEKIMCSYKECDNKAVLNKLYFDENLIHFYSSQKENFLDIYSIMGTNFFTKIEEMPFNFVSFCQECDKKNQDLFAKKDNQEKENIIELMYRTVAFKNYYIKFKHFILSQEFIEFSNSIKNEGYKSLMVYQLKKTSKELEYLEDLKETFEKTIKEKLKDSLSIYKFRVTGKDNFQVRDCFMPQIMPDTYKTINSNNNLFIKARFAVINIFKNENEYTAVIVIDKNDVLLKEYMEYWKSNLKDKTKDAECFITNTSLILCDTIIIRKGWFDTIEENEKIVASMFHKIRFDSYKNGKEFLTIRMLTNFNKGNNFFNF